MIRVLLPSILFLASTQCLLGQMWNGIDTLYGNEWIKFDQSYFKIEIAEDGIYRLDQSELLSQGIPVGIISGSQYQLFWMGEEIPVYVSTDNPLGSSDYIEFYGQKNRSELDRFLFRAPDEELLNPEYSLVTDTSTYFLTWKPSGSGPGKRYMSLDSDFNNLPEKEPWAWASSEIVFSEKFIKKYELVSGQALQFSHYDVAEGFGSLGMNDFLGSGNTTQTVTLEIEKVFSGGPESVVQTRFASGLNTHHQTISVGGEKRYEELFTGFSVKNAQFSLPTNTLTNNGSLDILYEGLASDRDKQSIAFTRLTYPRSLNFGGASYAEISLNGSSAKRYLEIEEFNIAGDIPVLYDKTNGLRVQGEIDGNILKFTLPVYAQNRSLVLINSNNASKSVASISPTTFVDYTSLDKSFVFISHPKLYDDGNGNNYIQDYADYRASNEGGSFSPQIIDIDQLYDQFAYGIKRHPLSIRNFAHFIKKNWPALEYIFLIGKGREYINIRQTVALAEAQETTFFIPSFGYPASDNLLFSNQGNHTPIVPIGRIAATDPNQVRIYLDKVKAFDETSRNQPQTIEGKAWMKRVIHLGGGGNNNERELIRSHLENMERTIRTFPFGANVDAFYKASLDPIQTTRTEQIFNKINQGASIITFFGHSSPGTFDFNIDNPENYNNLSKYPFMLSLGCYSGNIFTSVQSVSERFCFLEDKAAIAFGASLGLGFISTLGGFANNFYQMLGGITYGESIGSSIRQTLNSYSPSASLFTQTLLEQFILHGDPSIHLRPSEGPDYVIDERSVAFDPKVVSIQEDSFSIQFDVINLGFFFEDSLSLEIRQELPNGQAQLLKKARILAPAFSSSLSYKLPTLGTKSTGVNTFFISVDTDNEIDEKPGIEGEQNNELKRSNGERGIELFIVDNSATPIAPRNFGIISTPQVRLLASTTDALAKEQKYLIEFDTTVKFNSPFKRRNEIIQGGGLIEWKPNLPLMDSTTYYWRISPDSTNAAVGFNWVESSFTYIPGSPSGWHQGHVGQFKENNYSTILLDEEDRQFNFRTSILDMRIRNKLWDQIDRPTFRYNNGGSAASVRPWLYTDEAVSVMVGIPKFGQYWVNEGRGYGSVDPTGRAVFTFDTKTQDGRIALMDFLTETIPPDFFVYVFTVQNTISSDYLPLEWASDSLVNGENIFNVLEAQGALNIRSLELTGAVPYAFMYKKDGGALDEAIADHINGEVNVQSDFPQFLTEGEFSSILIGPANSWDKILFQNALNLDETADSISISIYGVSSAFQETLLLENIQTNTSLTGIKAQDYPYLRLHYSAQDLEKRTVPQLISWTILYEGLPDLAINPNDVYVFESDTLEQGNPLRFKATVENISMSSIENVPVKFSITDEFNNQSVFNQTLPALNAGDTTTLNFEFDSKAIVGGHQFLVEINPENTPRELELFNNLLQTRFFVRGDNSNPLLDVTFDGNHIINGDLVSSEPFILITLQDENKYLALSDTSLMSIFLAYPDGRTENISFSSNQVQFYPANPNNLDNENKATIEFQPKLTQTGDYVLFVQAQDQSGNYSGQFDYKVEFKVITENSISNVFNYPNPFSTSTQFVYTLTGEQPTFFNIQIMTVSGRIVREITLDELGPLKIGTHRTDYRWDGTDEFGDLLANGVYLYRVVTKDNNQKEYDHFDNGTSKFFKNNLGKLVILR